MHFNGKAKRDALVESFASNPYDQPGAKKFCVYIDLCIHPYTWDNTYHTIRLKRNIPSPAWNALLGVINALVLHIRMQPKERLMLFSEIAIDFVEFIRGDKVGDSWKFLLSMKRYLRRYCILRSLQNFGIDWRTVAYEELGAKAKPNANSFHSVFTNLYARTLVKATVVFKQMRTVADPDYKEGVNDRHSLTLRESASNKCLSYDQLDRAVQVLLDGLPSWNTSIRNQVNYSLSYMQDIRNLTEKQMLPSKQREVGYGATD